MRMQEILTINRINSVVRIPIRWINKNFPPADRIKILRELDSDRIIITPIFDNGETDHEIKPNTNTNFSTEAPDRSVSDLERTR